MTKTWEEEFDELMGMRERALNIRGNVVITDSKQVSYDVIKKFIRSHDSQIREEIANDIEKERQKALELVGWSNGMAEAIDIVMRKPNVRDLYRKYSRTISEKEGKHVETIALIKEDHEEVSI